MVSNPKSYFHQTDISIHVWETCNPYVKSIAQELIFVVWIEDTFMWPSVNGMIANQSIDTHKVKYKYALFCCFQTHRAVVKTGAISQDTYFNDIRHEGRIHFICTIPMKIKNKYKNKNCPPSAKFLRLIASEIVQNKNWHLWSTTQNRPQRSGLISFIHLNLVKKWVR